MYKRQIISKSPILEETNVDKAQEGSYVLIDTEDPEATLVATGSEVSLCIEYAKKNSVRVISMPSWELTNSDSLNIDTSIPSLSLEAGITLGWSRFADNNFGIDRFGSSAPGNVVLNELGINIESIQNALNQ